MLPRIFSRTTTTAARAISTLTLAAAALLTPIEASAAANHILLSEINPDGINPEDIFNSSEFIEIVNPTNSPISLADHYLTDYRTYYNLPTTVDGKFDTGGDVDWIYKFPAGSVLPARGVAVVTMSGRRLISDFFAGDAAAYFNQTGNPQLFETSSSLVGATLMDTLSPSPVFNRQVTLNLTNSGEFVVLFKWDGVSPLVQDVDIVGWNATGTGSNSYQNKGGITVTRPDSTSGTYLAEGGNGQTGGNLVFSDGTNKALIARVSAVEVNEEGTTGNGVDGEDATMEAIAQTWQGFVNPILGTATPGVSPLQTAPAPVISNLGRTVEFPAPSAPVTVTADATIFGGTINTIEAVYDTGSGATTVPMTLSSGNTYTATLPGFPEGTLVKWYVVGTSNQGGESRFPTYDAGAGPEVVQNGFNAFVVTADPVGTGDVIINEILFDNIGGDRMEFIELYNPGTQPVKLPYFRVRDNTTAWGVLPEDAEIAPNGFMVLTMDVNELKTSYTIPANVPVYDWGTFGLNNDGDEPQIVHVNSYDFNGTSLPFERVEFTKVNPWPLGTENDPNATNASIELINPTLDNKNGANWRWATVMSPNTLPGSPGTHNTTLSNVSNWSLY